MKMHIIRYKLRVQMCGHHLVLVCLALFPLKLLVENYFGDKKSEEPGSSIKSSPDNLLDGVLL